MGCIMYIWLCYVLLYKRYWRNVALTLFWKYNATRCICLVWFCARAVEAERRYFVSFSLFVCVRSYSWPAYSSSTPHSSTTPSQIHSSKALLAFKNPINWCSSVFPWNICHSFLPWVCVCADLCACASCFIALGHIHFWEIICLRRHL